MMNVYSRRKNGFTFKEAVIILGILVVFAALMFPVIFRDGSGGGHRSICRNNLKQIGLGFQQYVQDYDERFPIAISGKSPWVPGNSYQAPRQSEFKAFGWADALQPYLRSAQIFQCPSELTGPEGSPDQSQYIDYWYNVRLSGVKQEKLDAVSQTIINGDGNDGADATDARYRLMSIPNRWRTNNHAPLYRHLDGSIFAFADGHVKWLRANVWTSGIDANGGFTFRLKPLQ